VLLSLKCEDQVYIITTDPAFPCLHTTMTGGLIVLIRGCPGADWPEERHEPRGDDSHDQQHRRPGGHRDEDPGLA
jgi:hypothetical protein